MTRTPLRAVLPTDLIDRLEAEADRRGIPVEKLVEQALVIGLPRLWALILQSLAAGVEASQNKRLAAHAKATAVKGADPP